jgi:hypothetical protein
VREGPSVPCSSTTLSVMRSRVRASAAARSFFRYREGRRAAGRQGRVPRQHRRPVHDRRPRVGRALLARRAPDVAAGARRAAAPAQSRGRVQLRARGPRRALLGDEVVYGGPGDLIFKPRNQWHTFWNAGDEPARLLEIISPAGFERFFEALVDLGGVAGADPQTLGELCARYELEMDPDSVPGLVERFGVRFPGEPIS